MSASWLREFYIYIYIDNRTSIYLDTWKKKIEGINAKNLFINVTHRVSFDREEIALAIVGSSKKYEMERVFIATRKERKRKRESVAKKVHGTRWLI